MNRSIEDLKKDLMRQAEIHKNCNHEFDNQPSFCTSVGRFGGDTVNVYCCKKCGFETINLEEYEKALNKYDHRGMPKK